MFVHNAAQEWEHHVIQLSGLYTCNCLYACCRGVDVSWGPAVGPVYNAQGARQPAQWRRGMRGITWSCCGPAHGCQGIAEEGGNVLLVGRGRETPDVHPSGMPGGLLGGRCDSWHHTWERTKGLL
jgi:hypothetical protein